VLGGHATLFANRRYHIGNWSTVPKLASPALGAVPSWSRRTALHIGECIEERCLRGGSKNEANVQQQLQNIIPDTPLFREMEAGMVIVGMLGDWRLWLARAVERKLHDDCAGFPIFYRHRLSSAKHETTLEWASSNGAALFCASALFTTLLRVDSDAPEPTNRTM